MNQKQKDTKRNRSLWNRIMRRLTNLAIPTLRVGLYNNSYFISREDEKVGWVLFRKIYRNGKAYIGVLELGDYCDKNRVELTDSGCDGLVDVINDADGYHQRVWKKETPEESAQLEKRFVKADKIFASVTTTGEFARLIKETEDRWMKEYGPLEGDPLNNYLRV